VRKLLEPPAYSFLNPKHIAHARVNNTQTRMRYTRSWWRNEQKQKTCRRFFVKKKEGKS
jgi:hypothetical protein